MLLDLLGTLVETILGNVPQLGLLLTLLYGAHLLGKGTLLVTVINHLRMLTVLLVVGVVVGAIDVNPGVLMGLFSRLMGLATGLLG